MKLKHFTKMNISCWRTSITHQYPWSWSVHCTHLNMMMNLDPGSISRNGNSVVPRQTNYHLHHFTNNNHNKYSNQNFQLKRKKERNGKTFQQKPGKNTRHTPIPTPIPTPGHTVLQLNLNALKKQCMGALWNWLNGILPTHTHTHTFQTKFIKVK